MPSGAGDDFTDDEDYFKEGPRAGNGSADKDIIERRYHERRRFDHEQALLLSPYSTSRIDRAEIPLPTQPYDPMDPLLPALHPPAISLPPDPYQTFLPPPPIPSYSSRTRGRRVPSYNEHSPGFLEHEDYNEPRHLRRPPSFERRRAPSRHATTEANRHKTPFYDPQFPGVDSSRPQKFWDAYNSDSNISGYRSGELQTRNPALPPKIIVGRDRDEHIYPQYPPKYPSKAYSSHVPSNRHPSLDTTSQPRPYYLE